MIDIVIKQNGITVKGHANSADHGKDLVCAGVSAIVVGTLNCFDDKDIEVKMESGFTDLKINVMKDEYKIILKTMKTQLETIQKSYPKYITVRK